MGQRVDCAGVCVVADMSETTNGWPGKPGVPLNPEQDGWHWLEDTVDGVGTGHIEAVRYAVWSVPIWYRAGNRSPITKTKEWRYLGPCLMPDEAANREDAKWHEGYAVGVLDVRRGTAFGEPDPHYAALQKRCEEAERERDALRRDTSQQVTTDEMVRRLQHLGDWQAADRIEALQRRVAELEEKLDAAGRVLHKAGEQFSEYATQFAAHKTAVSDLKAAANKQWAERCFSAYWRAIEGEKDE